MTESTDKKPRRPPGWVAPGPRPRGAAGEPDLVPSEEEDLSYLAGDFRIFQLKRGHRWSLDDLITGVVAIDEARKRGSIHATLDLGTGIGSVLMLTSWAFPEARVTGIEAQTRSFGMAGRSVRYNGVASRATLIQGDLRESARLLGDARFDLVTGTPPYIPIGHGLISEKEQRGPCCFETRGGIEEYAEAAHRHLADDGLFVACVGAQIEGRGERAARGVGFFVRRSLAVVPKVGKAPLFHVLVMSRAEASPTYETFTVRDEVGRTTPEMQGARAALGMPPAIE